MEAKESLSIISRTLKEDRFRDKEDKLVDFFQYIKLPDYQRKNKGDEDSVVTPILLKILETLGYKAGVNLIQQGAKGGDKPDFRTFKNNLFILDAKSTGVPITPDSSNVSETPSTQISRYLKSFEGYKYGILFNLTAFEFYARDHDANGNLQIHYLEERKIDIRNLFENFQAKETECNDYENYLWFFSNFQYREITKSQFFEEIKNRKKQDLIKPDKDLLKATVYNSLRAINIDIQKQVSKISHESYEWEQFQFELQKIKFEFKIRNQEEQNSILTEEFTKQASYVLLIKLILIRILEDNDLIPNNLYDGGFKIKSEPPFSQTLKRILIDAKIDAGEIIPSFFEESIYNFYIENEETFAEILYELSKINFSEIDFDLIGDLYEHYLNQEERKEKGQYYTPHYIVEFILNRIGYFSKDFTKLKDKTLLDPSCGSGGFLVEAARRIRKLATNREGDAKFYIANNIYGTELTAFATFLCEVNLLVQILPLVKKLGENANKKIHTLNVYRKDSLLQIYNHHEINGEIATSIDLPVTASPKEKKFIQLVNKNDFDFIIGNPPYVGESGHKDIFRPLQEHRYWKHYYQGKSDYLYYFIILGLSKLKDGGKFSFITTQYWLTADGASQLRKYILNNAKILEIIDFKGIKLFPEAKGQENIIFILEKCEEENERKNNKIRIIQFHKDWVLDPQETLTTKKKVIKNFDRWKDLLTNKEQFDLFANPEKINFSLGSFQRSQIADVYYSAIVQGELDENAWYIYKKEKDSIQLEGHISELEILCNVNQGVVPGIIRVTDNHLKRLAVLNKETLNIKKDNGVFVVNAEEQQKLNLKPTEKNILKRFYKNSNICKSYIDFSTKDFLIYTKDIKDINDFPNIEKHLSKYKDLLQDRLVRYEEDYSWYSLHRARNKSIFESEKIMISYRTNTNSFAYTNYPFYSATDTYYINKKEGTTESLKYIFGVLISDHVLQWLRSGNCKIKGDALELFTTSVSKIPIPRIDFSNKRAKAIHDFIAGEYLTAEDSSQFKHHETTNTYIKRKGLVDYIMDWTKELYSFMELGFSFDIENRKEIKFSSDYQAIAKSFSNEMDIKRVETITMFDNHLEDAEVINNCFLYFRELSKDFTIKSVGELCGEGFSLLEPDNKLKKYGYSHCITLKLKDKKKALLEIKGAKLAEFISAEFQKTLINRKEITWEDFKNLILPQKEINTKIKNISETIQERLSPLEKQGIANVRSISKTLDISEIKKSNNINIAYSVLNDLIGEMFNS